MSVRVPEPGTVIDTDWTGYLKILRALRDRRCRVTFDRGKLEVMSPSEPHEQAKKFIGSFLEIVMVELGMDFRPAGSMTFRRRDLQRGLEPDDCYWISHWQDVTGKGRYDPLRHPPPDLAIEVELTRTMLNRIGIYEAMRVPEIWRWTKSEDLIVLQRSDTGEYREVSQSPSFPMLPLTRVRDHIRAAADISTSRWLRAIQVWARTLPAGKSEVGTE